MISIEPNRPFSPERYPYTQADRPAFAGSLFRSEIYYGMTPLMKVRRQSLVKTLTSFI